MTAPPRPGLRAALAAVGVVARALGGEFPALRPTAWRDVRLGRTGVPGRLWLTSKPAPPILLAAGVTPQGPADPRVMRLADALARAGRSVFVPELELARRRLDLRDRDRLVEATRALRRHPWCRGPVAALGFSFGGSYLLAAAGDDRVRDQFGLVASFGAYGDLLGLFARVRDRFAEHVDIEPEALRAGIGADLTDADLRVAARILRGEAEPSTAPQALVDLARALSPVAQADHVTAPVLLVHATDDPVIPVDELATLQRAFPNAPALTVRLFTHVDFAPTPARLADALRDLGAAWRLAAALLAVGSGPSSRAAAPDG